VIWIRYTYGTAKTKALKESTDVPAGQPADDPPNSDRFWEIHLTVPEWTVRVYWLPVLPMWPWYSTDWYPDPKEQSRTISNNKVLWFLIVGCPVKSYHPLSMLLKPEQLDSHWLLLDTPRSTVECPRLALYVICWPIHLNSDTRIP